MKTETMSFKEESEAMMEVFMESMKAKFPENKFQFSLIAIMQKDEKDGELAIQVQGTAPVLAYGLTKFIKEYPEIEKYFLMLKLIGE